MKSALIHIGRIKSSEILRDALKHNLRLIERETEIESHINPALKNLNKVLAGETNPVKITRDTVELVKQSTGKKLRANGVFAVEVTHHQVGQGSSCASVRWCFDLVGHHAPQV